MPEAESEPSEQTEREVVERRPERTAPPIRGEASPPALAGAESLPRESVNLCYRELKSVVVDSNEENLKSERGIYYDHIYQHMDEYPYWKYVGGGLVGIAFDRKVWQGSQALEGRLDAEGDNHVSLRLSGRTTLDGMSINVDMTDGAFGYLLFPKDLPGRESPDERFAFFADIPKTRVLTTFDGEIVEISQGNINGDSYSFYRVTPRRENVLGTALMERSPRDRWLGIRRTYWEGGETLYERPEAENLWLRTINVEGERTIEVAGRKRTQDVLCRYKYGPVALTNDENFRPRIERELNAWARQYRVVAETETAVRSSELTVGAFREAFDGLRSRSWLPLMSIPEDHAAEHEEWNNLGRVQLVFSRDPYDRSVAVPGDRHHQELFSARVAGEIVVNGSSLGTFSRCVLAGTPAAYYIGQFVEAQRYNGIRFGDDLEHGCRTMCEQGTCRLEVWRSRVPNVAVHRVSEARAESMKERQARIDIVNDFASPRTEWLEAYAGLTEDAMVPLLVVDRGKVHRSYSQDHAALGRVRLSFEADSNLRSSMTEESGGRLRFSLPGRLTVNGATFRLPSDAAAAVVEFRRRDDKGLYQEIRKRRIEAGRLERLVAGKSPARIRMTNFRSPALRVVCRGDSSGSCKVLASKEELERQLRR